MKYKLAFLLVLFYVYLPPIIMFDICKVYPIWVPPCDGKSVDIYDALGVAMLIAQESINKLCEVLVETAKKIEPMKQYQQSEVSK